MLLKILTARTHNTDNKGHKLVTVFALATALNMGTLM
jgi:hypothetical protein